MADVNDIKSVVTIRPLTPAGERADRPREAEDGRERKRQHRRPGVAQSEQAPADDDDGDDEGGRVDEYA